MLILVFSTSDLSFANRTCAVHKLIFAKRKLVTHTPILRTCRNACWIFEFNYMCVILLDSLLLFVHLLNLGLFRSLGIVARIILRRKFGFIVWSQHNNLLVFVALARVDGAIKCLAFLVKLLEAQIEIVIRRWRFLRSPHLLLSDRCFCFRFCGSWCSRSSFGFTKT